MVKNSQSQNSRMNSKSIDKYSKNSNQKITTSNQKKDDKITSVNGTSNLNSTTNSITNQQRTAKPALPKDEIKVHRGPLNVNSITMRNPMILMEELSKILDNLGIQSKKEDTYCLACTVKKLKFLIEINSVEKSPTIHVIKFFRKGNESENYMELCMKIFGKLNL